MIYNRTFWRQCSHACNLVIAVSMLCSYFTCDVGSMINDAQSLLARPPKVKTTWNAFRHHTTHTQSCMHPHTCTLGCLYIFCISNQNVCFFLIARPSLILPRVICVLSPTDGTTEPSDSSRKRFNNLLTSTFYQPRNSPDWDWTGKIWPKILPTRPILSVPSFLRPAHTLHPPCHPRLVDEPRPTSEKYLCSNSSVSGIIVLICA